MNLGAFAVLADLALAATVRAGVDPAARLATVHMALNFTGVPLTGRLEAASAFQGFVRDSAGRQGLSHVAVTSGGERVCVGSGVFIILKPPKGVELYRMTHRRRGEARVTPLKDDELKRDELKVLHHADETLASPEKTTGAYWKWSLPTPTAPGSLLMVFVHGQRVAFVLRERLVTGGAQWRRQFDRLRSFGCILIEMRR